MKGLRVRLIGLALAIFWLLGWGPAPAALAVGGGDGQMHVMQVRESLGSVAQAYGTTLDAILLANDLPCLEPVRPGQRLWIPAYSAFHSNAPVDDLSAHLPAGPFESVQVLPAPATQGQTVAILIATSQPASITLTFEGRSTPFTDEGGRQWALLGVHAMLKPGYYPLHLRAILPPTQAGARAETFDLTLGLNVLPGAFDSYDIVLPPSSGKDKLLDAQLIRDELAHIQAIFAGRSTPRRWGASLTPPLAEERRRITSAFGERRSYNGGPAHSYHEGVDFGAPEGTPVYAPADGQVVLAETLTVRGNGIILDHGMGVFSGYWHLSELLVPVGASVRAGELIGKVGTTGLSTGSHLHWELRVGGIAVNPLQWALQSPPLASG